MSLNVLQGASIKGMSAGCRYGVRHDVLRYRADESIHFSIV